MSDTMDPRDRETAKWLGQVIQASPDSPASSSKFLPTSNLTQNQATATSAAAIATEGRNVVTTSTSRVSIAHVAAKEATNEVVAPPLSSELRKSTALQTSASSNSLTNGQKTAAQRASRLAAAGADSALYHPRQSEIYKASKLSSAGAAASLAAAGYTTTSSRQSQQRLSESVSERGSGSRGAAAGKAAILAARDSTPYEIPQHKLSTNAGKAALLAHKDHKEYEVPEHQLSSNAGKAALLAAHDHVEYQVPAHELSANAGKAALLAAHDHKEYEVPVHQLSASASSAALLAHQDHREYEVPPHQLSANAGKAALLAHKDHREYEVPEHQMSANAGKAALLAHHDHKEYQAPPHTLSANAGKAALLAHRDAVSSTPKVNRTSAASAASALKAATQAHHDPAMRPTKPEDLQAKGAANALKAASQAHREAPTPFKYVHPSDDPEIGKLARSNTQGYLGEMEVPIPHENTVAYATMSYNSARARQSQADTYRLISDDAYRSAGLSVDNPSRTASPARSRANTGATVNKAPVDLMALARRNVDSQMAERGLVRTESQQSVSTIGTTANRGANLAFQDGQERQAEWQRERENAPLDEKAISDRINREMAQFDQQRKRNLNNTQMQSALMEAAMRNARLSMAQVDANRSYTTINLRDTQRMEDLLNEEKMRARRDRADGAQVDIGGGHFMSQIEIEAVAARRIQPVMQEMDEQVAEINRRKAEIQAQREAEHARQEAERIERQKQREIERERERNTKAAAQEVRDANKAKDRAAREELEAKRRREADSKRAAERKHRENFAAAQTAKREAAMQAKEAEKKKSGAATTTPAAEVVRTSSTEAVAVARTTERASTPTDTAALPGTNKPLAGQDISTGDAAIDATSGTHEARTDTTEGPGLHRSETTESIEQIATYQVESRGMATDTEGETDDEWADAMEETPAIERAEFVSIQRLTGENLASRNEVIREDSTEDAETASISTAKPGRVSEEQEALAPPLSKISGHEHTRFKEELA